MHGLISLIVGHTFFLLPSNNAFRAYTRPSAHRKWMNDNTDLAVKLFLYFPLTTVHFYQNLKFSLKHVHVFLKKKKKKEKSPNFHYLKKVLNKKRKNTKGIIIIKNRLKKKFFSK